MSKVPVSNAESGVDALVAESKESTTIVENFSTPAEITRMMSAAVDKGIGVEAMEKLIGLHERVEKRFAAKAFLAAFAKFQSGIGPVKKNREAKIASQKGGTFGYTYAELDEIERHVRPSLTALGLSYAWDSSIKDGLLVCSCTLTHVDGHEKTSSFTCPVTSSAGMSEQQKYGSALTFAQRRSLSQVLGITTADDTDGARGISGPLSEAQLHDLRALIEEVGIDEYGLLKWAGATTLKDVPAAKYNEAVAIIERKRKK